MRQKSDTSDAAGRPQLMKNHVHDCCNPTATCACGWVFSVPPICVSIEIFDGQRLVISEGFNCDRLAGAIQALRDAANKLEAL